MMLVCKEEKPCASSAEAVVSSQMQPAETTESNSNGRRALT